LRSRSARAGIAAGRSEPVTLGRLVPIPRWRQAAFIGIATCNTRSPPSPTFGAKAMLGTTSYRGPRCAQPAFMLDAGDQHRLAREATAAWRKGRAAKRLGPRSFGPAGYERPARRALPATHPARLDARGESQGLRTCDFVDRRRSAGAGSAAHRRTRPRGSATFLVLDPQRFRDQGNFGTDLDLLPTRCAPHHRRSCSGRPGSRRSGHATRRERLLTGVPLTRSLLQDLRAVARTRTFLSCSIGYPLLPGDERWRGSERPADR
jgi:hypothetical protein